MCEARRKKQHLKKNLSDPNMIDSAIVNLLALMIMSKLLILPLYSDAKKSRLVLIPLLLLIILHLLKTVLLQTLLFAVNFLTLHMLLLLKRKIPLTHGETTFSVAPFTNVVNDSYPRTCYFLYYSYYCLYLFFLLQCNISLGPPHLKP